MTRLSFGLNPATFGATQRASLQRALGRTSATATRVVTSPRPAEKSALAIQFESMWEAAGGPIYAAEVSVCDERAWRWDYFWPGNPPVALELQGGIYRMGVGGHGAARQYRDDCDKANEAARQGILLFRLATGQVTNERVALILQTLRKRQAL